MGHSVPPPIWQITYNERPMTPPSMRDRLEAGVQRVDVVHLEAYQCPYCRSLQPIKNLLCANCGGFVTIKANDHENHP